MKKNIAVELKGNEPDIFLITEVEEEDLKNMEKLEVRFVEAKTEKPTDKKGWGFLFPAVGFVWASLPTTATVIGVGAIGVVGGAASIAGGRLINKIWPDKK